MKKIKKALALIVALFCLLTAVSVQYIAAARENGMLDIPIITIPGTTNTSILDANGKRIMPDNVEISDILEDKEFINAALKEFAKCSITHRWDSYCDLMFARLAPIWEEQKCDNNGDPAPGTHTFWHWDLSTIKKKTSGFHEGDYVFYYDWRLDPLLIADQLDAYIDGILEVTGASQVGIVSRCYGSCIASAYLKKYSALGKVNTNVLNCPMVKGVETVEALFSGKIKFKADELETGAGYLFTKISPIDDPDLNEFLNNLITVMNYTGALDLTAFSVNLLLKDIIKNLLPRLLRASYASFPGYWAMISSEGLEEAIAFAFGGCEQEYAGLIAKIRNYHSTVQQPLYDDLDAQMQQGMKLMIIAKYGTPAYPYFEGSNYQSDGSNSIQKMTFGATAPKINETLSQDYIDEMTANGTEKYISADLKIDASTCRFRDVTWFFKDVAHDDLAILISDLMTYGVESEKLLTVWDDARYPQFMHKNAEGNIVPLEANDPSDNKWIRLSFFKALQMMFKALARILKARIAA